MSLEDMILRIFYFVLCSIRRNFYSMSIKEHSFTENHHPNYYFMPKCNDKPMTYECLCGPGFTWNTHTCVADGLNSHFEFPTGPSSTFHYAKISNHPVTQLTNFTLAFWIKVSDPNRKGIILTYSSMRDNTTIFTFLSGPTLSMLVYSVPLTSTYKLESGKWTHVVWKWNLIYGVAKWSLTINGNIEKTGQVQFDSEILRTTSRITFLLGHSTLVLQIQDNVRIPESKHFKFEGSVGFVNMWSYQLQDHEIKYLLNDCKLRTNGDVFQWSNFRSETRGLRMRWPSDIFDTKNCFSDYESIKSCDKFCSLKKGPKCQQELLEHILWLRTPADTVVTFPCPNSTKIFNNKRQTNYVSRECIKISFSEGIWTNPVVDGCISRPQLSLKAQTKKLLKHLPNKASDIPNLMSFLNVASNKSNSIFDISTSIECFNNLTKAQIHILNKVWTSTLLNASTFGLNRKTDMSLYPSLSYSYKFIKTSASAINNLLKPVNDKLWLDSNPPGAQADVLLCAFEEWVSLIADTLHFHYAKGELLMPETSHIHLQQDNFELQVGVFKSKIKGVFESKYPKYKFRNENFFVNAYINQKQNKKHLEVNDEKVQQDFETVSFGILWVRDILNKYPEDSLHQKLNSGLFFFMTQKNFGEIDYELISNISQSRCVRVEHGTGFNQWEFSSSNCRSNYVNKTHISCNCSLEGFYGVLSDLFDPNYVAPSKELNYVTYPTYFGCFTSVILCGMTSFCLCLRSSSNGPSIHCHFAMSIILGHMLFMFGTEEINHKLVCLVIATLQHFSTLSSFCWLMNEAFNLYILITYTTHSRTEHLEEGGSMLKYYVIGWGFPALFVGSFCGANIRDYLSLKMCYISWKHILFIFVPVTIIIVVTLLVLIFTVKEQMESSYSKNEKTNESINIYSKALWTQIVLLLLCWLFAVASLSIEGNIIKFLHAFFNILQGIFFYIFFYHLNEEVRNGPVRCQYTNLKKRAENENIPMPQRSGEILWDGNRPRGMNIFECKKLLNYKDVQDDFQLFTHITDEGDELVTTV